MLNFARFVLSILLELVPVIRTQKWAFRTYVSQTGQEHLQPLNVATELDPRELSHSDIVILKARSFDWLFMSIYLGQAKESSNG